jgi:tetratricopeptide (TPR) repeat protein
LLDFGISLPENDPNRLTLPGFVVGTPSYMAPEQIRGVAIDARADVFALACVLFECTTGSAPFDADDPALTVKMILQDEPPRLREIVPEIPPALEELVSQSLSKDSRLRPASARVMAERLAIIETAMPVQAVKEYVALGDAETTIPLEETVRDLVPSPEEYARAAEQALQNNDLEATLDRAQRAIDGGAAGLTLGEVHLLQAQAHRWRGETEEARRSAEKAMHCLPTGRGRWLNAATEMAIAASRQGRPEHLGMVANLARRALRDREIDRDVVIAAAQMEVHLMIAGQTARAERLWRRLNASAGRLSRTDPSVAGHVELVRAWRAAHVGDTSAYLRRVLRAVTNFEKAGDIRDACKERVNAGSAYGALGLFEKAERLLLYAWEEAHRRRFSAVAAYAQVHIANVRRQLGRLLEARASAEDAERTFRKLGNRRMETSAAIALSAVLRTVGALDEAEAAVRSALESGTSPPDQCRALAASSEISFARTRFSEARKSAQRAVDILDSLGGIDEGEASIRLAYAQALKAYGKEDGARAAIGHACARLLARASTMSNPMHRACFLERVDENVRTFALAAKWGVPVA